MNYQLPIEGIPEPESRDFHFGHLYVCIAENLTLKIGRSRTFEGVQRRVTDHRKHEPTVTLACHTLIPHVSRVEANLIRYLRDHGAQLSGTKEWFRFDMNLGERVIDYMTGQGADTRLLEAEIMRVVALNAHPYEPAWFRT